MAIENFIRVPVEPHVATYFRNFYDLKNGVPLIPLTDTGFFHSSVINFIRAYGKPYVNHIPKQGSSMVVFKVRGVVGEIGLDEAAAIKLSRLVKNYVREILELEVMHYQSMPGISVTGAITIVMAKYDIIELTVDSFRRQFDRRSVVNNQPSLDRKLVNHRVNKTLKAIYDKKFLKGEAR